MARRAEQVDGTRRRITEAAIRLHTTIGPASTSIASVAAEAGVTRLTVYRHFPDLEALFAACRGHWIASNPPPDPAAWAAIAEPDARACLAYAELYAYYRDHASDLTPIHGDFEAMPLSAQRAIRAGDAGMAAVIVGGGAGPEARTDRRLAALAEHLVRFTTWRSLVLDHDLDDAEAADLAAHLLSAVRAAPRRGGRAPTDEIESARPTTATPRSGAPR